MHIVVVASQKGGAGKTSLMRSLAVATHQAGHATALLDTDPQGSLTSWWNRREDQQPALVRIEVADFAAGAERLAAAGIEHKRTRPYRPQTNGEVERVHRTLVTEWAYARPYGSETARVRALPKFLHLYNHHRHHTALGGRPPISRVTNLRAQYS